MHCLSPTLKTYCTRILSFHNNILKSFVKHFSDGCTGSDALILVALILVLNNLMHYTIFPDAIHNIACIVDRKHLHVRCLGWYVIASREI